MELENDFIFLLENICLGLEKLPVKNKIDFKKGLMEESDNALNDAYELGLSLIKSIESIKGERDLFTILYSKDAFQENSTLFTIILGIATIPLLKKNQENQEIDMEDFIKKYGDFIFPVLDFQKTSISELHKEALELSELLKLTILAFKLNDKDTKNLEIFYELSSVTIATTFFIKLMLED